MIANSETRRRPLRSEPPPQDTFYTVAFRLHVLINQANVGRRQQSRDRIFADFAPKIYCVVMSNS